MKMKIALTFFVLFICGCVTKHEWRFASADQASTIQSITEFTDEQNEVSHIPSYYLLQKIDAL